MADKVLTMSGASSCPPCVCAPAPAPKPVKQHRYPQGRHCTKLNESGNCRCAKWATGRGEKVTAMCKRAGREFRLGRKTKT